VLRRPLHPQARGGLGHARGSLTPQLGRQWRDAELLLDLPRRIREIYPVAFPPPGARGRGASAIHAGCTAYHQRANDVETLTGEEEGPSVGVEHRPGVGAVQTTAAPVPSPLQYDDPLTGARELTGDRRPTGTGTQDRRGVAESADGTPPDRPGPTMT